MRPLWEAALEAQAQRVIAAAPRSLMELTTRRCLLCDRTLSTPSGAGRRNVTGYCSRTAECRTAQSNARHQRRKSA